jgi:signal transduction histidine kinase
VSSGIPPEDPYLADALSRHGFTEPGAERMLQNLVRLAGAFCGTAALLVIHDETGTWYRGSSGLTAQQVEDLDSVLIQPATSARCESPEPAFRIIERLPLADLGPCNFGILYLLSSGEVSLTDIQREGLRNLVLQIQELVGIKEQSVERRGASRGPSGASFVPGLVHVLRNFVFGIGASLDAFEARFSGHDETLKYRSAIRTTLERFNAFIEELREYGDPQLISFTDRPLEPLLREVIEHHRGQAERSGVEIRLQMLPPLPSIHMDIQALFNAFSSLLDLALQLGQPGSTIVLQAGPRNHGAREAVSGYLETSSLSQENVDIPRLFEPFYFRTQGPGRLALPVARRIFEAHRGSITPLPGAAGGLRLEFTLPAL